MRHTLLMLAGCLLPVALIFLLPVFGVGGGVSLFAFILLMFACHILMVRGHRGFRHERRSPDGHE